jgi:nitrate/TMAO reductase-like tetraheme cytochrome c subunit
MTWFAAGAFFAVIFIAVSAFSVHYTSTREFCTICHEMRIVGEQGWLRSSHYSNSMGIVANCHDCHISPELLRMFWTKTRDGVKDVYVHYFGESDPHKMPWKELSASARKKIHDSSCLKCHSNLTPRGSSIKTIIAHRAYERMKGEKRCLDCHRQEFHGDYKYKYLSITISAEE